MRMNRLVLLLVTAAFALAACKGPKSKRKKMPPPPKQKHTVSIIDIKNETYYPTIDVVAKANPVREVTHAMEASGKLVYLPGEIGESVEKGQLIARVRTLGLWSQRNAATARLTEIETALQQAKTDFQQMKKLKQSGAVTQHDFELADNALKSRQAQLDSARASLGQVRESLFGTSLFTDFNGEISSKFQQVGNFVAMGTPVYKIVDLSEIKVQFGISELEVTNVRIGDKVHLRAVAYPNRKWEGTVSYISPAADQSLGTFPVEVKFPNTVISETDKTVKTDIEGKEITKTYKVKNWAIKAGMTIQGRFFKPAVKGFFIPVDAVLRRGSKTVVFVVKDGNEKDGYAVEVTEVTVHDIYEGWYHVSGKTLKSGSKIVTTGNSRLRKDSKVVYKTIKETINTQLKDEWPDALTKATGGKDLSENKPADKSNDNKKPENKAANTAPVKNTVKTPVKTPVKKPALMKSGKEITK